MGGISTLLNDPDKSLAIALQKGVYLNWTKSAAL